MSCRSLQHDGDALLWRRRRRSWQRRCAFVGTAVAALAAASAVLSSTAAMLPHGPGVQPSSCNIAGCRGLLRWHGQGHPRRSAREFLLPWPPLRAGGLAAQPRGAALRRLVAAAVADSSEPLATPAEEAEEPRSPSRAQGQGQRPIRRFRTRRPQRAPLVLPTPPGEVPFIEMDMRDWHRGGRMSNTQMEDIEAIATRAMMEDNLNVSSVLDVGQQGGLAERLTWDLEQSLALAPRAHDMLVEAMRAEERGELDTTHVAAGLRRLGFKLHTVTKELVESQLFEDFLYAARSAMRRTRPDAAQTAGLLKSVFYVQEWVPRMRMLLPGIIRAVPIVAPEMSPQNVTSSLWAVMQFHFEVPQVTVAVPSLMQQAYRLADDMEPMYLAGTLEALGELELGSEFNRPLRRLAQRLVEASVRRLEDFEPLHLARLAWGLAGLQLRDPSLLRRIGDVFQAKVPDLRYGFRSIDYIIPKMVCSLARLRYPHPALIEAIAGLLLKWKPFGRIGTWGLAALGWSWPTGGPGHIGECETWLAEELERRRLTEADVSRCQYGPERWN